VVSSFRNVSKLPLSDVRAVVCAGLYATAATSMGRYCAFNANIEAVGIPNGDVGFGGVLLGGASGVLRVCERRPACEGRVALLSVTSGQRETKCVRTDFKAGLAQLLFERAGVALQQVQRFRTFRAHHGVDMAVVADAERDVDFAEVGGVQADLELAEAGFEPTRDLHGERFERHRRLRRGGDRDAHLLRVDQCRQGGGRRGGERRHSRRRGAVGFRLCGRVRRELRAVGLRLRAGAERRRVGRFACGRRVLRLRGGCSVGCCALRFALRGVGHGFGGRRLLRLCFVLRARHGVRGEQRRGGVLGGFGVCRRFRLRGLLNGRLFGGGDRTAQTEVRRRNRCCGGWRRCALGRRCGRCLRPLRRCALRLELQRGQHRGDRRICVRVGRGGFAGLRVAARVRRIEEGEKGVDLRRVFAGGCAGQRLKLGGEFFGRQRLRGTNKARRQLGQDLRCLLRGIDRQSVLGRQRIFELREDACEVAALCSVLRAHGRACRIGQRRRGEEGNKLVHLTRNRSARMPSGFC